MKSISKRKTKRTAKKNHRKKISQWKHTGKETQQIDEINASRSTAELKSLVGLPEGKQVVGTDHPKTQKKNIKSKAQ